MTPERWRQLTGIFHAALARDAPERAAFVASSCKGDPEMRREVEAMLAAHDDAGRSGEPPLRAAARMPIVESPVRDLPLATESRIGPYEIVSLLGIGGMGAVYRARDTKLHRDVAVKVLLPAVAHDPDRLARFAREARVLASLDHPNIARVHELEEANGIRALVMELVDGPTLADRIAQGPLPVDEALLIASQIAQALEAAHEHGIVHRDLKPANVKVRLDGTVKVLDFGLARAIDQRPDGGRITTSSVAGMTVPGVLLGTAAYMAPEQAQGRPVDRRADIWAFGCVLFEMLTGQRAFGGETLSHVIVTVLEHDPDWKMLPVTTAPSIRRLLRRCLEKDPKRRLDSAAVVRIEIDEAAREPTPVVQAASQRSSRWRPLVWTATGAGAAMLVIGMLPGRTPPSDPSEPLVSHIRIDGQLLLSQPGIHFAVAPSGKTVAFAVDDGGSRVLYRRDLDRIDPEPIAGTQGASDVFFSHDGRGLGFEVLSELWTVSLDGATPQRLFVNQPLRGGTWSEGDKIVVGRVGSGLWLVSTSGGEPRQLSMPERGDRHELPQMLPGGRAVLFTIFASDKPPRVAVHILASGETRSLFEGVAARFVRSGHLVFGRQGKLWAVGFDPGSLKTVGTARVVRDDVVWSAPGYPQFVVGGGALAYVRASTGSSGLGKRLAAWIDRHGRTETIPIEPNNFLLFRLSPTADRVVAQIGASRDLWAYDFRRGTSTRLTSDRIIAYSAPVWTPDGTRVAFTTWFEGEIGLGLVRADGSGQVEELVKGVGMRSFERTHPAILPDGTGMILSGLGPGAMAEDLLFVPLTGERRLERLFQAAGNERNPAVAPSGRLIAYNSDESSRSEVYVRPFPDAGSRKWQISTEGGVGPVWTRGGSEIVYVDGQGRMVAVAVRSRGNDAIDFSKPEPLFTLRNGLGPGDDRVWDVTSDGKRFLVGVGDEVVKGPERAPELILIQNWADELTRIVRLP